MYTENQLNEILDNLIRVVHGKVVESEVVEFKEAANGFQTDELGKYFSALSNEANLAEKERAWIIFGVNDNGKITGSNYLSNPHAENDIKRDLGNQTPQRFGIKDIYHIFRDEKHILMIEIPPAPQGLPISYKGHYYGRDGQSLVALSPQKRKLIESQIYEDWSRKVIDDATIDDLDPDAIQFARQKYLERYPELENQIRSWDTVTLLNKSKITIHGKITNAAIVLLGKSEAEHMISPCKAEIKWILKSSNGDVRDYHIAHPPLILSVNEIYHKIINLKYRYMSGESLFPEMVDQYHPYIIREALHNAIAHQDYMLRGSITIVQTDDTLMFKNLGAFIPKTVEQVIKNNSPETRIRNPFLATAMVNYMMVDTIGSGIIQMFKRQSEKFFPLPDYTITDESVEVLFTGRVIDEKYAKMLAQNKFIDLGTIILLDKIQKGKTVTKDEVEYLKSNKLIEGRKPNYIISSYVATSTGQIAIRAKAKGLTTKGYETIILESIDEYGSLFRSDIDGILENILPTNLTNAQKKTKVNHLLSKLKKDGVITNVGSSSKSKWMRVQK